MDREALYNELIQSEPLGFIDPFSDLGEFDPLQMKFKQPVKDLVNRYSGQPYSLAWQHKIMEMRKLFIAYQIALNEEDKQINFQRRTRSEESKEHATTIVTTYLKSEIKELAKIDYVQGSIFDFMDEEESNQKSQLAQAVSQKMQERKVLQRKNIQQSQGKAIINTDFMRNLTNSLQRAQRANKKALMERERSDERQELEEKGQSI